jgi:hypothetical protein
MLPPFILWRTVAEVAAPGEEGRRRLLLGIDGRHGLLRPAALNVEPIGVGGLESVAFDLVAAGECLHLPALGLLVAEVDRAQGALTAGRAGRRFGVPHDRHRTPSLRDPSG